MKRGSDFVDRIMTNGGVLPVARAIVATRLLCRPDIIIHLSHHGRSVQAGQLLTHIVEVIAAAEAAFRGRVLVGPVVFANQRHFETGVHAAQLLYVWTAVVDAYLFAARRAGYQPTISDLRAYVAGARDFGDVFGLVALPTSLAAITSKIDEAMAKIDPASIPPGGWRVLVQVARSPWFKRGCELSPEELVQAIKDRMPASLIEALRR